jgi:membrane protein YqaA with SNARE-associated domain
MYSPETIATLALLLGRSARHWFFSLGGLGLIPLGVLDCSLIPIPGFMDVLTIVLAARDRNLWPYYAAMATAGSLLGSYITYNIASKGGERALARRISRHKVQRFYKIFERWGFGAIVVPAVLPPPVPFVAFLFAAGAAKYPVKKFLLALLVGRGIRYTLLAFLAGHYGRYILTFISPKQHPVALPLIAGLLVLAVIWAVFRIIKEEKQHGGRGTKESRPAGQRRTRGGSRTRKQLEPSGAARQKP